MVDGIKFITQTGILRIGKKTGRVIPLRLNIERRF